MERLKEKNREKKMKEMSPLLSVFLPHPANRAVVKRALEPLRRMRLCGHRRQPHEVPCDRARALAAHRVALVRHGARPDLAKQTRAKAGRSR